MWVGAMVGVLLMVVTGPHGRWDGKTWYTHRQVIPWHVYQVEWRVGVAKWVSEWEHFLLISVLYGMNQDLHSNFSMHRQVSFSKQNTNNGVHNSEDIDRWASYTTVRSNVLLVNVEIHIVRMCLYPKCWLILCHNLVNYLVLSLSSDGILFLLFT